jgi:hypothetical protein
MSKRSWLEENYKAGASINAPHPRTNKTEEATITSHTIDSIGHPYPKGATGIMVQFDDGVYMEIERGYLNENGGGVV